MENLGIRVLGNTPRRKHERPVISEQFLSDLEYVYNAECAKN